MNVHYIFTKPPITVCPLPIQSSLFRYELLSPSYSTRGKSQIWGVLIHIQYQRLYQIQYTRVADNTYYTCDNFALIEQISIARHNAFLLLVRFVKCTTVKVTWNITSWFFRKLRLYFKMRIDKSSTFKKKCLKVNRTIFVRMYSCLIVSVSKIKSKFINHMMKPTDPFSLSSKKPYIY